MNAEQKHSSINGYALPVVQSVALHVVIFGLLYFGYSQTQSEPIKKITPAFIKAVVIEKQVEKPKAVVKPKSKPKPKPKVKAKPKAKAKPKVKSKVKSKIKPKPKPKVKPKPKPKPKPAPKLETKLDDNALDSILAEEELELVKMEQAAKVAQAREVERQRIKDQYAALMQKKIERYWSRPPSARNGMRVSLSIKLFPGGDVREVTLLEGSGDTVFDRSAMLAVQKAGFFEVPTESDIFQQYFRKINLVFRPEDLRL
ncbi:MAG: cell envelope integrity protein TolA [Pseudomonadales bacterium]|nr:cell envelope integrity protein TolA [Pseudomonadales bacterium]